MSTAQYVPGMENTGFSGVPWGTFRQINNKSIDISGSVANYIREEVSRVEIPNSVAEALISEALKRTSEYVFFTTKITDMIRKTAKELDIEVTQCRAAFTYDTSVIHLLIIINCDSEEKIDAFHKKIAEIKTNNLSKTDYMCDCLVVSKQSGELDDISVDCDYPFIRVQGETIA